MYPEAKYINLVMDTLNIHHYHSLIESFGKQEADRIMSRLRFHFTPTHASWLNMAEVELSVLSGQCLSRRIADDWTLRFEITSWENARNERKAQICWKFTTDDARKIFKQYYRAGCSGPRSVYLARLSPSACSGNACVRYGSSRP